MENSSNQQNIMTNSKFNFSPENYVYLRHISQTAEEKVFQQCSERLEKMLGEANQTLTFLKNTEKSPQNETLKFAEFPIPKLVWMSRKLKKLFSKQIREAKDFYEAKINLLNQILNIIQSNPSSGSGTVNMVRLQSDLNFDNCKKYEIYQKRYTLLNSALNRCNTKCSCYGSDSVEDIWKKMEKKAESLSKEYESAIYFPYTDFDEDFIKFICKIKLSKKFESIINTLPQFDTIENIHGFLTQHGGRDFVDYIVENTSNRCPASAPGRGPGYRSLDLSLLSLDPDFQDDEHPTVVDDEHLNAVDDDSQNQQFTEEDLPNAVHSVLDSYDPSNVQLQSIRSTKIKLKTDNTEFKKVKSRSHTLGRWNKGKRSSKLNNIRIQQLRQATVTPDTFQHFITSLFYLFLQEHEATEPIKRVFLCAVFRALFDFYYIKHSAIFFLPPLNNSYMDACQFVLNSTPSDLELKSSFLKTNFSDIPIVELLTGDSNFLLASYYMDQIQFFTNPLDMAVTIHKAKEYVCKAVNTIRYLDDDVFETDDTLMVNNLMRAVYALSPFRSPHGMLRFITTFKDLFNQFQPLDDHLDSFSKILMYYKENSD